MQIEISGSELIGRKVRYDAEKLVKKLVDAANLPDCYLSVVFVVDEDMRALNAKWRGKDEPTDVLSFSAGDGTYMPGAEHVLGDLVISVDTAKRQAKELGHSFLQELGVLVAHGIMHLLGLDHERSEDEAVRQAECEMAILDGAGISPEIALTGRMPN